MISTGVTRRRSKVAMSWPPLRPSGSVHGVRVALKSMMVAAMVALSLAGSALAETYPSRPIRVIVPHTAGSPTDIIARLLAKSLSPRLGQSIVIINRPGGGTVLGTREVICRKTRWLHAPLRKLGHRHQPRDETPRLQSP